MPATLRVSNKEAIGHVRLVGDQLAHEVLLAGRDWMRDDVHRRILSSATYGFTDRKPQLRYSLRVVTSEQARDARGRFVSAGYAELRSDVEYAEHVEYRYGGRFSYARRAQRETASQLQRRVEARVAAFTARAER